MKNSIFIDQNKDAYSFCVLQMYIISKYAICYMFCTETA